ncbi:hypothetical protein POM88_032888 [Heracleum sosnowskyi]|uniref:Uncharacterized protein n=1 Tax=Heracleum sosnowskyi TaxID=360622 RepID=A0AAD8MHY5_9APIA|nr:hypothetical protein POM88_032888 [Heracleum sosnowskyi]
MAERTVQRLQKMNQASKRGIVTIHSSYMFLQDMISQRGDDYPSVSHLDSFDCRNKFHEVDKIRDYNKMYKIKSPYRLIPAGPGDRSCHWRPDALCIYKDAIVAGLRVSDGSPTEIVLTEEEAHAYAELTKDTYATMAWELLDEFLLKSLGLSSVSDKTAAFINKGNEPTDGETARMKRARLGGKDTRGAFDGPAFLRPHTDSVEEVEAPPLSKASVWHPNWGIRKKDIIVGVSKHATEWSYHSLTPCDYKDFVTNSTIEGVEHAGSQALAASNANFRGALFQAKAWRSSSEANQGKFEKSQEEVGSLRATLARREKELADSQAELVELRKSKDDFIDEYLDSQEYTDLIGKHDELLFPVQFTKGWDGALEDVLEKLPGSLYLSDFPSPYAPTPLEVALGGEDDMDEDDRILDLGHSSPPGQTAGIDSAATHSGSGSSSGEEEADTGDKGGEA